MISLAILALGAITAGDQPHWGEKWNRNMVSAETNLPAIFNPKTGQNIKWTARLGDETHSTPVIANGRVYIGTNNGQPRNPKHQGDRGVLMCFEEKTGAFLWQLVVPKRSEDPYFDWPKSGISSSATVDGDRIYIVSNRGEVLCLDPHGLKNGNDGPFKDEAAHQTPEGTPLIPVDETDADILWAFDMTRDAGIWSHDGAHSAIIVDGDFLYLNTGTGVDNTHRKIRTPDAPSLIVLDKHTGRLLARERESIAPNIFHCTWSSPALAEVNGRKTIFFAAGNGIIYAFEALRDKPANGEVATLKKIWQFDPDPTAPKTEVHRFTSNRREGPSNTYGMPVYLDGLLYLTGGGDLWWGKNEAWFKCIRAEGTGDITARAEVWSYPLNNHTMSTAAVAGGLAFVSDCGRTLHCVDSRTGKPYWTHEIRGEVWASPYVADGKMYIGTRRGDFWVFKTSKNKEVLHSYEFGTPISATTTAANATLYIATMTHLHAIAQNR
jgi:outer membrane protein assembly factor BamB